jgi:hypothetical protein
MLSPVDSDQAAHARKEGGIVDRFGEKVVGAGLEARDAIARLVESGDHDYGHMGGLGIVLDAPADLETVHARHHDVQKHDVWLVILDLGKSLQPAESGHDIEIFCGELGFEQLDVRKYVVDDEDPRGHEVSR